jgi:hypothetical protein
MADIKLDHALKTIDALFGDTSVQRSETRERLETVVEHCKTMLDTLDADEERETEALLSQG